MKKTYVNAMLHVVSIKKNDIVTASQLGFTDGYATEAGGADRFRDWEEY